MNNQHRPRSKIRNFAGLGRVGYWLSSRNFFHGGAKSIVMQISFVMLIFLLFSDQISGGTKSVREGGLPQGRPPALPVEDMIFPGFPGGCTPCRDPVAPPGWPIMPSPGDISVMHQLQAPLIWHSAWEFRRDSKEQSYTQQNTRKQERTISQGW